MVWGNEECHKVITAKKAYYNIQMETIVRVIQRNRKKANQIRVRHNKHQYILVLSIEIIQESCVTQEC